MMNSKELITAFLNYEMEYYDISYNTFENYRVGLEMFADWLLEYKGKQILDSESMDFIEYKNFLSSKDYRNATISSRMACVKNLLKWASSSTIDLLNRNPFPPMTIKSSKNQEGLIPTAKEILRIRSSQGAQSMRQALAFEFMLSSGLRVSEFCQIRCCDIEFDPKLNDHELKRFSPFIGGRINLTKGRGIGTKGKGGKRRITYISRLAAKLVKRQMEIHGLTENSPLPILPENRKVVAWFIRQMGCGIFEERPEFKAPVQRQAGFLDLDLGSLDGVSPEYIEALKKIQAKEKEMRKESVHREKTTRIDKTRKIYLHPHALRHFFAVWQYYRNYYGNRRDLLSVRDFLGHASIHTTDGYVNGIVYIENDLQWKQIALGNGTEYLQFFR